LNSLKLDLPSHFYDFYDQDNTQSSLDEKARVDLQQSLLSSTTLTSVIDLFNDIPPDWIATSSMPSLRTIGFTYNYRIAPTPADLLRALAIAAPNITCIDVEGPITGGGHDRKGPNTNEWITALLSFKQLNHLKLRLSYDDMCEQSQTLAHDWLSLAACLTELVLYFRTSCVNILGVICAIQAIIKTQIRRVVF
jgi:hypothetical protein